MVGYMGIHFEHHNNPYADDFYQMADRYGIATIGETPAVRLGEGQLHLPVVLDNHKQVITEMIGRDKNHPSVLMCSLANEPALISQEIARWRQKFPNKPLLVSEFGVDTVVDLHNDPPLMFTEEYQKDFYLAYHGAFEDVSSILHPDTGYFVGELVWNMFDFATEQNINRVGALSRKGIFTRQRQPNTAAFLIKNRYEQL
jgi:beta-galactosidase/beta-glucuronidase